MIKEKATINGRKRNIYRGPKGGKYYMRGVENAMLIV